MSRKRKTGAAPVPRRNRRAPIVFLALLVGAVLVVAAVRSGLLDRGPGARPRSLGDGASGRGRRSWKPAKPCSRRRSLPRPGAASRWCSTPIGSRARPRRATGAPRSSPPGNFGGNTSSRTLCGIRTPPAALDAAEAASRLKPEYAPAYVLRAQLLEASNESSEALEQYRKAAELDPESAMAEFGAGPAAPRRERGRRRRFRISSVPGI